MIATSHFAEVFRDNDSLYMTRKPLIEYYTEQDTSYFHAKNIQIIGPDKERIIKGYPNARVYRTPDMSGKADSLHYDEKIGDRKSTRLNSSHVRISYAVFCLKKKKKTQ